MELPKNIDVTGHVQDLDIPSGQGWRGRSRRKSHDNGGEGPSMSGRTTPAFVPLWAHCLFIFWDAGFNGLLLRKNCSNTFWSQIGVMVIGQ